MDEVQRGSIKMPYWMVPKVTKCCVVCCQYIHAQNYFTIGTRFDSAGKEFKYLKTNTRWGEFARLIRSRIVSPHQEDRQVKKIFYMMRHWVDSDEIWGVHHRLTLSMKRRHLLDRGISWVTPLGGMQAKAFLVYACTEPTCMLAPISTSDWYFVATATQVKMIDQLLTLDKIMGPQWRCPFCHKRFTWSGASRALILDHRLDYTSEDPLIVLPIRLDFDKSKDPIQHAVANNMEQMLKFCN